MTNNERALPLTQYQTCLYSCIWSIDLQGLELCMFHVMFVVIRYMAGSKLSHYIAHIGNQGFVTLER